MYTHTRTGVSLLLYFLRHPAHSCGSCCDAGCRECVVGGREVECGTACAVGSDEAGPTLNFSREYRRKGGEVTRKKKPHCNTLRIII